MKFPRCLFAGWALVAFTVGFAAVESAPVTTFTRLDLTDGRTLRDVTVKSYDPATGRVLLLAGRTALSLPVALIPAPFDAQVKAAAPVAGSNLTTIAPRPVPAAAPAAVSPRVVPVQVSAAPATPRAAPVSRHREAAANRARRFFTYEFQAGSSSISVYECEIETEESEAIAGWDGRFRTQGRAYLQFYDSRGRSFSRTTSRFEVITEQKPGKEVTVVDFTRLGESR
jgi:hypothetical protein